MTAPRRRLGADERRGQLMTAAVELLAEQGYGGATADAIARRAGVSKGLLWHYFADRDDLLEQTARTTLMSLARVVGDQLDQSRPAPEVVRAAIRGAAALRRTHGRERDALREVVVNLRTADGRPRLTQQDYEELYTAQETIFRRGLREGHFRSDLDPRLMAVTYQGAVDAMLGHLDAHPEEDADRCAATLADILLGGMGARPVGEGR